MLSRNTLLQNRYLIKRAIAKGGMGVVYEAEAIHLGNTIVAVKQSFFDEAWLREQFEREAAVLARLRHPVLPKVTDHFSEGGGQFLVMEFIPGDDLEKLLARRAAPFEWRQVAEWADRLLDALDYIHTQYPPVIHRDIKPSNLKLTPRGELMLLDFGLAKNATTPTRPGSSVHAYTPGYAPPEQIKGTGTDVRCDLYSLGATLYNLLTNEAPAEAKLRAEMMAVPMPDPLRPAHLVNRQIPMPLSVVIARAMAVDRERRYATAAGMREALREARQSIEETLLDEERRKQEAARLLAEQQRLAEEARRLADAETERLQREETERRQKEKEEAERKQREEAERRRQEEAERQRKEKEEAERKLRAEAERRRKEEAERKAREEAEWRQKEKEEAERKLRAAAERKHKEEAARKQNEARQRELAEQRRRAQEIRKQRGRVVARLAIWSTLFLLLLLLGYGLWKASQPGEKQRQGAVTPTIKPAASPLPTAPPPSAATAARSEVLRYSLEIEGERTRATSLSLASGKNWKLHFTPQTDGYLYLLAPNANRALQTF